MSDISKVKVNVPLRSSFDKSFKNILTTHVGTITPLVSKLVIPNSDIDLTIALSACLPPLASDTFMRCSLKVEAFFVPLRLLYGGFESYLTGRQFYNNRGDARRAGLPRFGITSYSDLSLFAPGSLADYLGLHINSKPADSTFYFFNIFKFLAYHRVYDDWYRNKKIQTPVFTPVGVGVDVSSLSSNPSILPFVSQEGEFTVSTSSTFKDGVGLFGLRQRNYGDDYFTIATTSPQSGSAQSVYIDDAATVGTARFTISALRAANSLQQFAERNNLSSPDMVDYCKINYGANLSSGLANKSILLGSASYDVYSKGIFASNGVTATNNPFTSVGAQYGMAYASGSDFHVKGHIDEPAYLFVNVTLVPEANYSDGISHDNLILNRAGSLVDIPVSNFENVGNEPIFSSELTGDAGSDPRGSVFGYVPRYSWHKTSVNEVHGNLKAGENLDSFVAQRSFGGTPQISDNFLRIGRVDLNHITAVTADLSNYGCWIDSYIKLFVSEPLSESSLPSLQDPNYEHGREISVKINGERL